MNILLNNRKEVLKADSLTVSELLRLKNFTFKMLVIKINGELIKKEDYSNALIHEGDAVSVLHMISGG